MTKKIAVFTGTRAEYGLLYWLIKDIQSDPELTLQLLKKLLQKLQFQKL